MQIEYVKLLALVSICLVLDKCVAVESKLLERRKYEVVYEHYGDLSIFDGNPSCENNCTYMSIKKKWMKCSMGDCDYSITSDESHSSPPQITEVSFVKFIDKDSGTEKLALKLKWSPKDRVDLKYTTGYLLNITDGISSYVQCYRLYTPMNYHSNKKDELENSCFGKHSQTFVRRGSIIRASISSLPLNRFDSSSSRVDMIIHVPVGDSITSKSCASNCRSTATDANYKKEHKLRCEHKEANSKDSCVSKMNGTKGKPSKVVEIGKGWYKYKDILDDNRVKLALNFSWMPGHKAQISNISGYYIEVQNGNTSVYKKCFSLAELSDGKYDSPVFFLDCYGRNESNMVVKPGGNYNVQIWSVPGSHSLKFPVDIPGCDDPRMFDVFQCQDDVEILTGIINLHCNNKTIDYSYKVSNHYGDHAMVAVCQGIPQHRDCTNHYSYLTDLEPHGVLHNLSLPSSANLSLPHYIKLMGNKNGQEYDAIINFSACTSTHAAHVDDDQPAFLGVTIAILIILLVVILYIVLRIRTNSKFHENTDSDDMVQEALIQEDSKVFVVTSSEWNDHNKIVLSFCSFLREDHGVDINVSLWDEREVFENVFKYFIEKVDNANKVIIFCSKKNKGCLKNDGTCSCLFCIIVKHICDLSFGINSKKFVVVHYCSEKHLPERLVRIKFPTFKLMEDFQRLYFLLSNIEQYQHHGMKITFDEILPEGIQESKHGKNLFDAITEQQNEEILDISEDISVFVIGALDSVSDKTVLSNFCSYLKAELGFDVETSLWDEEASWNKIEYYYKNIKNAKKIIIICSKNHNNNSNEDTCDCMFCRVVRYICKTAFGDQVIARKCMVVYFDYSSVEDIPTHLLALNLPTYKLLHEFEQLYFQLIGKEQYHRNGMIKHVERVQPQAMLRTMYGKDLFFAIENERFSQLSVDNLPAISTSSMFPTSTV